MSWSNAQACLFFGAFLTVLTGLLVVFGEYTGWQQRALWAAFYLATMWTVAWLVIAVLADGGQS